MAESPSHKFGQLIGEVLEAAILPLLVGFAKKHNLYLDKKGPRQARRGNKLTWKDHNGNTHDLDFVLERDGSNTQIGAPVAFIEAAWRRYTKHSRNKAQEIQGAIIPLAETYARERPFRGAILAGVFTEGALQQLNSLGFKMLFFPFDTIVTAFKHVGINAYFDEQTSDADFQAKLKGWDSLSAAEKASVATKLVEINRTEVDAFLIALETAILRTIKAVRLYVLHGAIFEWSTIAEAIQFMHKYEEADNSYPFARYEIQIQYNNGDLIDCNFSSKDDAVEFLKAYVPVVV